MSKSHLLSQWVRWAAWLRNLGASHNSAENTRNSLPGLPRFSRWRLLSPCCGSWRRSSGPLFLFQLAHQGAPPRLETVSECSCVASSPGQRTVCLFSGIGVHSACVPGRVHRRNLTLGDGAWGWGFTLAAASLCRLDTRSYPAAAGQLAVPMSAGYQGRPAAVPGLLLFFYFYFFF